MSTRSVIARPTKSGFVGRYHHWDGYPSGLGATLCKAYHGHFQRNLDAMCRFLLDDHPAGFSTIVGRDLSLACGFAPRSLDGTTAKHPECFCHGDRSEEPQELTEKDAAGCGCEYAYLLISAEDQPMMRILSSYTRSGDKMIGAFGCGDPDAVWREIGLVELADSAPDWSKLDPR